MKDGDEYQRSGRNHTVHVLFTALRISDNHILPPFIQTNKKNCVYGERSAKEMRGQSIIISASASNLHPVLKPHSSHSKKKKVGGIRLLVCCHSDQGAIG